jgi:hypothetical protein
MATTCALPDWRYASFFFLTFVACAGFVNATIRLDTWRPRSKGLSVADAAKAAANFNAARASGKPVFRLSDGLLLAGIPGFAYAVVALFQAGYLAYFGVPLTALTLDPGTAFWVLGNMFRVGTTYWPGVLLFVSIAVIGIPAVPYLVPLSWTDRILRKIPGTLLAMAIVDFCLTPFVWAPFPVSLTALYYLYHFVTTTPAYEVSKNAIHVEKWISLAVFRIIIVGLLSVPAAFLAGYKVAEGGFWCGPGREIAALDQAGNRHYYLMAAIRPADALGIEITDRTDSAGDASTSRATPSSWSFGDASRRALIFTIFEHPLVGGIRLCENIEPIHSGNSYWLFYRPIDATKAYIELYCRPAEVPISRVVDEKN